VPILKCGKIVFLRSAASLGYLMNDSYRHLFAGLAACGALAASPAMASCGSAFCTVNTEWTSETAAGSPGGTFDLRYENIDQKQPRTGSRKLRVGEIPRHHDEVSTKNDNLVASYSRTFESGWGFSLVAPIVSRDHLHIHNHQGQQLQERWRFTELGDVRATGRYQRAVGAGDSATPSRAGVIFGLKLPTGRIGVANDEGEVAERSLQPGTGTTDGIIGAYFQQDLPQRGASWFAQAQYQRALNSRDEFKPGAQLSVDLGYGQAVADKLSALVQLNLVVKGRHRGANAEPEDSGGQFVFLSPGLSYAVSDTMRAYAFFQQPLHQHVNGVQLTARHALLVGVTTRF
jgi:hypothetical protein